MRFIVIAEEDVDGACTVTQTVCWESSCEECSKRFYCYTHATYIINECDVLTTSDGYKTKYMEWSRIK